MNINATEIALIKYINGKEVISDLFLKKVQESSQEKKRKANKICQIVFEEKQKEKSANKLLQDKIQEKKEAEVSAYKTHLELMKSSLKDSSAILRGYQACEDKKDKFERYRERHLDYVNQYWSKLGNIDEKLNRNCFMARGENRFEKDTEQDCSSIRSRTKQDNCHSYNFK